MAKKIKIAIATSHRFKPMGTFSKNYEELLPFEKITLFGGFLPYFYKGTSKFHQKIIRYFFTLISFKNQKKIDELIKNRFKKILKKENIDCVLAEFFYTGSSIKKACEELNIPIVCNVLGHDINNTKEYNQYSESYAKLANYNSIVVPVAKNMIPKLKNLGYKDEQIVYSPLGARDEFFEIMPNYSSKVFVAVGRFVKMKSPLSTIKAFNLVLQKHPDAKLFFAGDGVLYNEMVNLIEKLNIKNSVEFLGWISQTQQTDLFARSSIFVQHSITTEEGDAEGTPVAIIEASASGLPIVSTKHGGIIDTVINEKTGFLVEENDWESMAEKMIYLLDNPEKIKEMGKEGRKFISENFSMRKHVETVRKCIEKLT